MLGLPNKTEIGSVAPELAGANEAAVLAAEADRATAGAVDRGDELLVDGASKHHFDDFHRLAVGDPKAIDKVALDVEPLQHLADLRTATMHDDRIDADLLQEDDIAREGVLRAGVAPRGAHRMAAVFDQDRLAGVTAQKGQSLGQDRRL